MKRGSYGGSIKAFVNRPETDYSIVATSSIFRERLGNADVDNAAIIEEASTWEKEDLITTESARMIKEINPR